MSIVSHGLDLVECPRIADLLARHSDRFLKRVFTEAERERIKLFADPVPHVAGRFAAKEAVLKVLGTGWRGQIAWTDIEVLPDVLGQPLVTLHGECARLAEQLGIGRILLSITHTDSYAAASAIGLSRSDAYGLEMNRAS